MHLSKSLSTKLYYQMIRIRMFEEKIAELYHEQEMRCPVHLCIGQEAVPVGVCNILDTSDYAFSGHRSHGHFLAKGGDMKKMIAEIYGKSTGCCGGKGGSMHLIDKTAGFFGSTAIVSGTIPVAVGTSFATKLKENDNLTVVFFGDAATEEGVFYESINFALLHKLPIIFVCENNLYATYLHIKDRQPDRKIFSMIKGMGIKSYHVDGNDVIKAYKASLFAKNEIKKGKGPVFLEFETYRWREHCGPNYDNDIGYRTQSEFIEWKQKCPIDRLEKLLKERYKGIEKEIKDMRTITEIEVEEAFNYAKTSDLPKKEELFTNIFWSEVSNG